MALPHRACIRVSRKQQVTTLCPGHYPRGTLLAGTQGESHGILAHRKKEWSPRAQSWAEILLPKSERKRQVHTTEHRPCGGKSQARVFRPWCTHSPWDMSIWILKRDRGDGHKDRNGNTTGGRWKRHTRKIGALQLTEMKDIQKRWVV